MMTCHSNTTKTGRQLLKSAFKSKISTFDLYHDQSKRQTKTLEADLSEQQKRRVRILADAYLELNTHELYHFNNVMEKKTSLDSVLAASNLILS